MAHKQNILPSGTERSFKNNELIVSKTDLTGRLTYGNRKFYEIAGLSETECLGQQHNIIRHPDMPRAVFDLLWETIQDGREIFAYVINLSSNGDHYWVFAHVTPSRGRSGEIDGYHSNRRAPNKRVVKDRIIPLYSHLRQIEQSDSSPKSALQKSRAVLTEMLANDNVSFNQLMLSLEA